MAKVCQQNLLRNQSQRVTMITDKKLAQCVKSRCEKATIIIKQCIDPDLLGRNNAFLGVRSQNIKICENNFSVGTTGFGWVAIHEWAHSCGWDHNDGCGVPGNSGTSDRSTGL